MPAKRTPTATSSKGKRARGRSDRTGHPFAPTCCSPDAFDLMAAQVAGRSNKEPRLATSDGLVAAACAVALQLDPNVEPQDCLKALEQLAKEAAAPLGGIDAARRRAAANPQAVVAHLHRSLFDVAGFAGNDIDYYRIDNSSLPAALSTRRGLPITLAMVYKLVASRLGLRSWGVGLPGHFVAGVEAGGAMLVDCFDGGRILDRDDARERVAACAGPDVPFNDDLLRPVSHRHWVTRLMQNLLQVLDADGRHADVAAILELELLLWPEEAHLARDLGLVLARIGQGRPAKGWLTHYLDSRPDDPQNGDLRDLVQALA
ncbi:MAG: transglutaminase-like domain-containing protein [Planctomycetota bacterium]